jgi:hypothetical protein
MAGRRRRRYSVEAALRFAPCRVTVGGRALSRARWRHRRGVLTVRFTAQRGTLRAARRC